MVRTRTGKLHSDWTMCGTQWPVENGIWASHSEKDRCHMGGTVNPGAGMKVLQGSIAKWGEEHKPVPLGKR
jgi:hypothetical protein